MCFYNHIHIAVQYHIIVLQVDPILPILVVFTLKKLDVMEDN